MGEDCCKEKEACCKGGYCDMSGNMLCLADQAWAELMREKMKAVWEKERGPTMDNVADLVVKHSMAIWKNRMEKQDMKANLPEEEVKSFTEALGNAFKD